MRLLYINTLIIFLLAILLSGCTTTKSYTLKNRYIFFNNPNTNDKLISLKIDNKNISNNVVDCSLHSYTINQNFNSFGRLLIENIPLDSYCKWNGLSRGYYESFFEEKSKITNMKLIKRFDIKNYEFSQYKIDNKYLLNLIFIWNANESTFIIDYKGKFTNTLLEKLSSQIKLPINDKNINLNFNYSLAKENWIKQYFSKEDYTETVKIEN